jgi:hypothetical protein
MGKMLKPNVQAFVREKRVCGMGNGEPLFKVKCRFVNVSKNLLKYKQAVRFGMEKMLKASALTFAREKTVHGLDVGESLCPVKWLFVDAQINKQFPFSKNAQLFAGSKKLNFIFIFNELYKI